MIPQTFKFSSQKKHKDIKLTESNTRAKCSLITGSSRLVIVEPSVSGSNPCRAVFKINEIGKYGWVAVGLCLPSVVTAKDYEDKGNLNYHTGVDNKHGTFVIFNGGNR